MSILCNPNQVFKASNLTMQFYMREGWKKKADQTIAKELEEFMHSIMREIKQCNSIFRRNERQSKQKQMKQYV